MLARTLRCPRCGWLTACGPADVASRLRLVGVLRREKDPDEASLAALLPGAAERMTCPACNQIGLVVSDAADDDAEEADWQAAVLCQGCRKPIDPERVEALPGVTRCAACQGKAESGAADDEPEFCPRCGAYVELRVSRSGGLTRYRRFCTGSPACRL